MNSNNEITIINSDNELLETEIQPQTIVKRKFEYTTKYTETVTANDILEVQEFEYRKQLLEYKQRVLKAKTETLELQENNNKIAKSLQKQIMKQMEKGTNLATIKIFLENLIKCNKMLK